MIPTPPQSMVEAIVTVDGSSCHRRKYRATIIAKRSAACHHGKGMRNTPACGECLKPASQPRMEFHKMFQLFRNFIAAWKTGAWEQAAQALGDLARWIGAKPPTSEPQAVFQGDVLEFMERHVKNAEAGKEEIFAIDLRSFLGELLKLVYDRFFARGQNVTEAASPGKAAQKK